MGTQNIDVNAANQDVDVDLAGQQQPNQTDNVDKTNQDGNGTDKTVNQDVNLEEWQKDGRYGKMWNKPDDMYNSYKSLEKSFNDLNPKYNGILKVLKENGFSAENLTDELKKFADYRNPQSRINQIYNYVNGFLNNDIYSARIQQFFEQLEQEELQRLYPNMNAEQIAKQQAMDKEIKELKAREAQRQEQLAIQNDTDTIMKGLGQCDEIAKKYGFKLTNDVKNYLLTHCSQNNIDPKYIMQEFMVLYGDKLLEARDKKIIENQEANRKKLEQAQILGGGASKQPQPTNVRGKAAFTDGILKIFDK